MSGFVLDFYDRLAPEYHLMFADWRAEVMRQSALLARLLRAEVPGASHVLDCACGIGTQAIGLARAGYQVTATDLSPGALQRALEEAQHFQVDRRFATADFRRLEDALQDRFHVVCCLDNAIAHLQEDHELHAACASMARRLHPGGLLVLSIRDYDRIFAPCFAAAADPGLPGLPGLARGGEQSLPGGTLPRVFDGPDGRRIAFQVWDWSEDRRSYAVHQYFVHGDGDAPRATHYSSRFRALRRAELGGALLAAGLREVRWLMPEHVGFYQPLVLARAP